MYAGSLKFFPAAQSEPQEAESTNEWENTSSRVFA